MQQHAIDTGRHWLNRDRLRVYPRIFLLLYLIAVGGILASSRHGIDAWGKPLGSDFIAFWGASHTALHGAASDAYDLAKLAQAQKAAIPAATAIYGWFYPPTFYLLILPLALLPYAASFALFSGATLGAFLVVVRRVLQRPEALLLVLAFPGVYLNLVQGQNGCLTAALAAGALILLSQRPLAAGAIVGLLIIKPHLAVLFPVALLAAGYWRAALAAGFVATLFAAASAAVLSPDVAWAFVHNLTLARSALEQGALPWGKMPTVFAMMRLLGFGLGAAYAAHAVVALCALAAVGATWRQPAPLQLKAAALMTGSLLVSPYLYDYDLVWLAFPIAWLGLHGLASGWLRGERELLVAAWVSPLVMSVAVAGAGLQVGALVTIALFAAIVRRVFLAAKVPA